MTKIVSWTLCGPRDVALLVDTLRAIEPTVDECAIVWTGSDPFVDDPTFAGAHWHHFPWTDSFAAARNAALDFAGEIAPGGWGLMLDADERVRCPDPSALRTFLATVPADVDIIIAYAADGSHGRERLFRLPCPHRWVGSTHETIPGKRATIPTSLIAWEERPKSHEQLRAKFERDERLLAEECAEHPNDPRWHAYRGSSLAGLGRYEEAVAEYHAAGQLSSGEDSVSACYRAADLLVYRLGKPEEAIAAAMHGMALNPTVAEMPWIAAVAAMHLNRPDYALAFARIAQVHGTSGPGRFAMGERVGHRFQLALEGGPEHVARAAKAAMAPKMSVRALVFSKDRPLQLDACLRSLRMHCADMESLAVDVIVKATSEAYAAAYDELAAATPWATLHPERDFYAQAFYLIHSADHVLFVVDDTVFVRGFSAGAMVDALERHPDAIGFSLRLGRNCTWTYPGNREQTVPGLDCLSEPTGYLFSWPGADGDFGYPREVSSSLYRSADVLAAIGGRHFANPNELEVRLAGPAYAPVTQTRLLCPPLSVAFSVPANKVQTTIANRAGGDPDLSPPALLSAWQAGLRIDVSALVGHVPNACHEEIVFTLSKPPRIEAVTRPISITVTSTGFRAAEWAGRCIESVQRQTFAARHVYVAADQDTLVEARACGADVRDGTGRSVFENLLPIWRSLPDDEVIAWLDGDDWLATEHALRIVAEAHAAGALATYGSFVYADGSPGFAAEAEADVRNGAWLTTHLKTFRAGLVKRIREEDFRGPDGGWAKLVTDQRVMIPCMEMAGERARFLRQNLYVYNHGHSFEAGADAAAIAREHAEVRRIRAQRRYGRLTWGL